MISSGLVFRPGLFTSLCNQSNRCFHLASVQLSGPKSPLAKLRKKTGYSLTLCRQALEKHDQDVAKAEAWLQEQALAQGWAKAQKLQGRNAAQGLVGVLVKDKAAAMIELNCETDFVARNQHFHELLNQICYINLSLAAEEAEKRKSQPQVHMEYASGDQLSQLKDNKGRSLSDLLALHIGQIGENMVLRRGIRFSAPDGFELAGLTHPSASVHKSHDVQYGRYGVVMGYTKEHNIGTIPKDQTTATMARQLCQHIIGMNPAKIGDMSTLPNLQINNDEDEEDEKEEEEKKKKKQTDEDEDEEEEEEEEEQRYEEHDELIRQEFLIDTTKTVGQVLQETGIAVDSFVRFEVGQDLEDED